MPRSNAPETDNLTSDEKTVFENARHSIGLLKKTFETWQVIGKSVVMARQIADRLGGRKTFMLIIEQQGLGEICDKSTASRLEKIMGKLPEITAWHQTLTGAQQISWASPTAIFKHCPAFNKPKAAKPVSRSLKQDYEALQQANVTLQEALNKSEEGARWKATDTAGDIATCLLQTLPPEKARQVARQMLTALDKQRGATTKRRAKTKARPATKRRAKTNARRKAA